MWPAPSLPDFNGVIMQTQLTPAQVDSLWRQLRAAEGEEAARIFDVLAAAISTRVPTFH